MLNKIMGDAKQTKKPSIGMGVTILHYTDRTAGTIIEVSPTGKTIKFQLDKVTRVDKNGMSDSQEYSYEPNPQAEVHTAYLTRHGQWKVRRQGYGVLLDCRRYYHDYSF